MEYVGLGMYAMFFLWLIWVWHTEFRDDRTVRTTPTTEPAATADGTADGAAGENLQGQSG